MRRAPEYSELMSGIACSANVAWSAMEPTLAPGVPRDPQRRRPAHHGRRPPSRTWTFVSHATAEGGRWHTVRGNWRGGVMSEAREHNDPAASERWFRSLLMNISDTVSITDAEGRFLFTSGASSNL